MDILRSGHGPGYSVTESIEAARGRRYPANAVRFRSNQVRHSGELGPVMRTERRSPVFARAKRHAAVVHRAPGGPVNTIMLIFLAGLGVEIALPWALMWLSDLFLFDIPAWSLWLVFGGPLALTVLALGLYEGVEAAIRRFGVATAAARRGR